MLAPKKPLILISALCMMVILVAGCRGFRRPMGPTPTPAASEAKNESKGWTILPINVTKSAEGNLRVELAIRNDTGSWSAMAAAQSATVTTDGDKSAPCDIVQVSSGRHHIPPGFQMRGYTLRDNKTQLLYVECKGVEPASATHLSIPYSFVTGEYDYYAQDKNKADSAADIDLSNVSANLTYPVASSSGATAQAITDPLSALNECTVTNTKVSRSADAIAFQWKVANPGEYDTKVHIGTPPVLGSDGIVYGVWVSPDIVDQPFAPSKGEVEFETQVSAPQDVTGLYLLLSVEQSRERLFAHYLIDLTKLE